MATEVGMHHLRLFVCGGILILIGGSVFAGSVKDWQGEWGQWSSPDNGAHFLGASMSIFDCSEKTSSCRWRFDSESSESRCSTSGDLGSVILISAPDSARVQFLSSDGTPNDCFLDLKLQTVSGASQIQLVKHSGSQCISFCTEKKVYFPDHYPFRTSTTYPELSTRECFADPRKSREIWCTDAKVQESDRRFNQLGESIDTLNQNQNMDKQMDSLRESFLNSCNQAANVAACLQSAYEKQIGGLSLQEKPAQETRDKREKALSNPGNDHQASQLIDQIDGVYKKRFSNALVDGSSFTSEDILELVRVSKDTFYFRTHLEFYNGHECNAFGLAQYTEAGTFVYNDTEEPLEGEPRCRLQIEIAKEEIQLKDPDSSCKKFCGARGNFDGTVFPKTARRAIRYMEKLKNSEEYKNSIAHQHP